MVASQVEVLTSNTSNKLYYESPISLILNRDTNFDENNISKLLAGNNAETKENLASDIEPENQENYTAKDILLDIGKNFGIGIGLGLILAVPLGILLAKFNLLGKFFKATEKIKYAKNLQKSLRPHFIKKELKLRKMKLANFKPIEFEKCKSLKEVKKFGKKLGIKISGKDDDIAQLNDVLKTLTDLRNQGKGRIVLPKQLKIAKDLGSCGGDADRILTIRLLKNCDKSVLLHELGHINHFQRLGFIKDQILDAKTFADFGITKDKLKYIRNIIGDYATTKPHEFVAECYDKLLQGEKLPDRIMKIYKMLKGPTNYKYIKEPIKCHDNLTIIAKPLYETENFNVVSISKFAK